MTFPIVYDRARTPTSGPQPGAIHLRGWILANYPALTSLGIYNNRSIRGGSSLSTHAEGRAIDIGTPTETAPTEFARGIGRNLANRLVDHHAALGVQQIIFDRLIWRNTTSPAGWRPYTGSNPHVGHIHIELTRAAALGLTPQIITDTLGGTTMPTAPDRTEHIKAWQRYLAEAGYARAWWDNHRPIDPDNTADIDRYADGDFGATTQGDSIVAATYNEQDELDETIVAKAALLDEGMAWLAEAKEATS